MSTVALSVTMEPLCGLRKRQEHPSYVAVYGTFVMFALCNRVDHYIFMLFLLSSFFFFLA